MEEETEETDVKEDALSRKKWRDEGQAITEEMG